MKRTKILGATAAMVLAAGMGSAAWGYWSAGGSGDGSATVGTLDTVSLVALAGGDSPSTALVPGGTADLVLRINNLNAYPVDLVGVAAKTNGAITPSGGIGTCTTTGVHVATLTNLTKTLDPGQNVVHLDNGVSMDTTSDTGCQGASFQIDVTIQVQK